MEIAIGTSIALYDAASSGGSTTPDQISNLTYWFDVSTLEGYSNGDVSPNPFPDSSGQSNNATRVNNSRYYTGGVNDLPFIGGFNDSDPPDTFSYDVDVAESDFTLFAVQNWQRNVSFYGGDVLCGVHSDGGIRLNPNGRVDFGPTIGMIDNYDFHGICYRVNHSTTTYHTSIDGSQLYEDTAGSISPYSVSTTRFPQFAGRFYECIHYSKILTDEEVAAIWAYLATKYNQAWG